MGKIHMDPPPSLSGWQTNMTENITFHTLHMCVVKIQQLNSELSYMKPSEEVSQLDLQAIKSDWDTSWKGFM